MDIGGRRESLGFGREEGEGMSWRGGSRGVEKLAGTNRSLTTKEYAFALISSLVFFVFLAPRNRDLYVDDKSLLYMIRREIDGEPTRGRTASTIRGR